MATFYRPNVGHYSCTAVLIAPRWLLTAAHCKIKTSDVAVVGGPSYKSGVRIAIKKVFNFKQSYRGDYDRDIGLVLLENDAPSGSRFAKLNSNKLLPLSGAYTRVIGYGRTSFGTSNGGSDEGILRSVDVPTVKQGLCRGAYHTDLDITSDMVCAGKKGCDACLGDSGGPLVQYDAEGEMVVVGVVSAGFLCGNGFYPGIYMRVASFLAGIRSFGVEFKTGTGLQIGKDGRRMQVPSSGKAGRRRAGVGGGGGRTVGTRGSWSSGKTQAGVADAAMTSGGGVLAGWSGGRRSVRTGRVGGRRNWEVRDVMVVVGIGCLVGMMAALIRVR